MADTQDFGLTVPLIQDPEAMGTNRTYLGNPLYEVEATGFTSTVREQYVLHGQLSPNNNNNSSPASLIIIHFSLHRDTSVRSRRFRSVSITLSFTSLSGAAVDDPAVRSFAPAQDGNIGVIPTTVLRQIEHQGSVSAKVEVAPAPVNLGFMYGRKDSAEFEQHVLAVIDAKAGVTTRARDRDGFNTVTWTVTENDRQKRIPDSYQLAVLLERKNDEPFVVKAKVNASVDVLYAVSGAAKELFLRGLRFPVKTYDPVKKVEVGQLDYPEGARKRFDEENLGALIKGRELDKLSYVHVVEQVDPASLYGGTQPVDSSERLGSGDRDDEDRKPGVSLDLSLNFGGGKGQDNRGDGNNDDDN